MVRMALLPVISAGFLAGCLASTGSPTVQPVQLTDNSMSCDQLYQEVGQLDQQLGHSNSLSGVAQGAATAHGVAGHAMHAAAHAGNAGAAVGIARSVPYLGMLGGLAQGASAGEEHNRAATQQRRDHLAQLFVNRGCTVPAVVATQQQVTQ